EPGCPARLLPSPWSERGFSMMKQLIALGLAAPLLAGLGAWTGAGEPKTEDRSLAEVKRRLAEISGGAAALPKKGDRAAERLAALRRLNAYRYLSGAPADAVLDDQMNREAEAAAALCQRIGRLDHNPPNPGMKEEEYKLALKGVNSCNLHQGQGSLVEA